MDLRSNRRRARRGLRQRRCAVNASIQAEVLAAAADGDPLAWDALVSAMLPIVWQATLTSALAEEEAAEVCQVVTVRLAQHLHELAANGDVVAWLAHEAKRECQRVASFTQRRTASVIPLGRRQARADAQAAAGR